MSDLEAIFPKLRYSPHTVTSPETRSYNCIAWAADDNTRWWWPDSMYVCYWPPSAPRVETIDAFVAAYRSLGFELCEDDSLEAGFTKIAIYADFNGSPKHAAKQVGQKTWSSKLGRLEDISHEMNSISGGGYGEVSVYMKKPISGT